jgi:hypothetical protein
MTALLATAIVAAGAYVVGLAITQFGVRPRRGRR